MRFDQMLCGVGLTASEQGNERARQYRQAHSWGGLIRLQRIRRIECELEKLQARLAELSESDPSRYYDGDYNEVYEGLLYWQARDPSDESQWIIER